MAYNGQYVRNNHQYWVSANIYVNLCMYMLRKTLLESFIQIMS